MFGISKTLGLIVLAVVFLTLAGLATFFYNSDQAKQADINNSPLLQKGKAVLSVVLNTSGSVADSNVDRNTGFGNKMVDTARNFIETTDWRGIISGKKIVKESINDTSPAAPVLNPNNEAPGFFSKLITSLKEEWTKMRDDASYSDNKTETIFNVKSGVEENGTSAANQ